MHLDVDAGDGVQRVAQAAPSWPPINRPEPSEPRDTELDGTAWRHGRKLCAVRVRHTGSGIHLCSRNIIDVECAFLKASTTEGEEIFSGVRLRIDRLLYRWNALKHLLRPAQSVLRDVS
jgi:hypothetical protein